VAVGCVYMEDVVEHGAVVRGRLQVCYLVLNSRFGVQGSGFGVKCSGFRV